MQKTDGSGNFDENNPVHIAYLNSIESNINWRMSDICPPLTGGQTGGSFQADSYIRFKVNGIYFWKDDIAWTNNGSSCNSYCFNNYAVNPENSLNIFFYGDFDGDSFGGCGPGYNGECTNFVAIQNLYTKYKNSTLDDNGNHIGDPWLVGQLTLHEIGHCLGQAHSWTTNAQFPDKPYETQGSGWCDSEKDANCSNNIMSYSTNKCYMSQQQIAHIHQLLISGWRGKLLKSCRYDNTKTITINNAATTTWDFGRIIEGDLVIENHSTLIVKCKLSFSLNSRVIIKPGSKLILDGGVLTNNCDELWEGIEVWGNSNLAQTEANQGKLELKNNAIIEFAREAVRLWNPNDWNGTGGIISAQNSTFRNNTRSAEFVSYHSYSSNFSVEIPNKSSYSNCSFIWDDNYIWLEIKPAITLWQVNGVTIKGCDFIDNRVPYSIPYWSKTKGIFSLDAGYKVLGRALVFDINHPDNNHTTYNESNFDVGYFKNLEAAIDASNSQSIYSITVDHCKFENSFGVLLKGVNNAIVTRNKIVGSSLLTHFQNSSSYKVEGNIVQKTIDQYTVGYLMKDSGPEENKIYRNSFVGLPNTFLDRAFYAQYNNSNDQTSISNAKGLQWNCNTNQDGFIDFYVSRDVFAKDQVGQGVRLIQGAPNSPADNIFSIISPNHNQSGANNIITDDYQEMKYYYGSGTNKYPNYVQGLVMPLNTIAINTCPSSFQRIKINGHKILLPEIRKEFKTELDQTIIEIDKKYSELKKLFANGDRSELHVLVAQVNQANKLILKLILTNEKPFLSETLLKELGEKSPSYFPSSWYKDLIVKNIESARSDDFMKFLKTKTVPLSDDLYNEINQKRFQIMTERGDKELAILELNRRKEEILNDLIINELSDSINIQWDTIKKYIVFRDHKFLNEELINIQMMKTNNKLISDLTINLENDVLKEKVESFKQEMQDLIIFKNFLNSVSDSTLLLHSLDDVTKNRLVFYSNNLIGKASLEAKNMLCFFSNICDKIDLMNSKSINSKSLNLHEEKIPDFITNTSFTVIPNPNKGFFRIKLNDVTDIRSIEIVDIQGRKMKFNVSQIEDDTYLINMNEIKEGIYLINITNSDNESYSSKIFIH